MQKAIHYRVKAIHYRESRLSITENQGYQLQRVLLRFSVLSKNHFVSSSRPLMSLGDGHSLGVQDLFLMLLQVSKETMATRNPWDDDRFIMWP